MKYIYFSLLLLFVVHSKAQTISANEWPNAGDTSLLWAVSDTNGIPAPSSGTNKTWDYSALNFNKQATVQYKFQAPKDATNGASFTTANLAFTDPGQGAQTIFFSLSGAKVEAVGANIAGNTAMKYNNNQIWMSFPANYPDDVLDAFAGSASGFGGTTNMRFGSSRCKILGSGTLKLPGKTYSGAVLAEIILSYTDSVKSFIGSFGTLTTENRFLWFVPGQRGWVFEIRNTSVTSAVTGTISTKNVYMKQAADPNGIATPEIRDNILQVFPNPGNEYINIQTERNGLVEVYNTTGICINTLNLLPGTNNIKIYDWAPGIYILRLGSQTCRLVVAGKE